MAHYVAPTEFFKGSGAELNSIQLNFYLQDKTYDAYVSHKALRPYAGHSEHSLQYAIVGRNNGGNGTTCANVLGRKWN